MYFRNAATSRSVRVRSGASRAVVRRSIPVLEALEGRVVLSTITVTGPLDDGNVGSLRFAINQVNLGNFDTIDFAFTDPNAHTIAVTSPLPAITKPVTINPSLKAVTLDGTSAGASADGLTLGLGSDGSTVKGFDIVNFSGVGIVVASKNNMLVKNNLGVDESGSLAKPNLYGIILQTSATGNTIGGANLGNLISGNLHDGILVQGLGLQTPSNNTFVGNTIGLDAGGTKAIPNGFNGILLSDSMGNTIGAAVIGGAQLGLRNVISGNTYSGIDLQESSTNVIIGNLIGTGATGTTAVPNKENGIALKWGVHNVGSGSNRIGGGNPGEGNIVSGNMREGISLNDIASGTTGNQIQGNIIGLDITGTATLGNGDDGIQMLNVTTNFVGTDASGVAVPGMRNIISGNARDGVMLDGSDNNVVAGNDIGTDITGMKARGNVYSGVSMLHEQGSKGASNNRIGGADLNSRNVISGNSAQGIYLASATSNGNMIQGNIIGLDSAGNVIVSNAYAGIILLQTSGNFVGTDASGVVSPGMRNIISGNGNDGVKIDGSDSNIVVGNYIGTDITGLKPRGNAFSGVSLLQEQASQGSSHNHIGGEDASFRNVISANGVEGVFIDAITSNFDVIGANFIGVDATGKGALGNAQSGVYVTGAKIIGVGDYGPGGGNVISSNGNDGVTIVSSDQVTVLSNLIGTDATGLVARGNADSGVNVRNSTRVFVGDFTSSGGNVISGNLKSGVTFDGTRFSVVQNNIIGSDQSGTVHLGNLVGVTLNNGSTDNSVGFLDPNKILYNTLAGVSVLDSASLRNKIVDNVLFNSGPGIDLGGNGVTANTPGGPHVGPNLYQNTPILTFAAGGKLGITLNAAPLTSYIISCYSSRPSDPLAGPQAERELGGASMTTDAAGNAGPIVVNYQPQAGYTVFSATATDPAGNTSELSGPADPNPLKAVVLPASFTAGVVKTVVIGAVADLDPNAFVGRLGASVNWGDGSPVSGATLVAAGPGFSVVGTHTYTKAGTFAAVVTVADAGLGVTVIVAGSVQVAPPPIRVFGRNFSFSGASTKFSSVVATFNDAGSALPLTSYVATIAWGDGTIAVGKITGGNGVFSVQASRKFNRFTGVRTATITIADASGRRAFAFDQFSFAPGRKAK